MGLQAAQHGCPSAAAPSRASGRAQTSFDFLKWECLDRPRQEKGDAGADALGRGLGKQLEGVCVPWVQHGRGQGD